MKPTTPAEWVEKVELAADSAAVDAQTATKPSCSRGSRQPSSRGPTRAFVGWLIWSVIVWRRGHTPGKQLLGMYCVKLEKGEPATWGTMFMREIIGKIVIMGLLGIFTLGIAPLILNFRLIWHKNRQELWDSVAGTIVARG